MAMPAARGLFHKAIAQSGFALRAVEPEEATRHARALLATLDLGTNLEALQKVPTDALLAAFQRVRVDYPRAFRPTLDGRTLTHHPWHPAAPPESADVPLMLGVTRDETTILLGLLGPDPDAMWKMSEAEMRERLTEYLSVAPTETDALIAAYRASWKDASPADLYFRITSDWMMRLPSILQAERKAAQPGAPAYLYLFTWDSPAFGPGMGAHHGAELTFVFDTLDEQAERIGTGEDRRRLADQMLRAWSRFAHTGDPNHAGLPSWKPYSSESRDTMIFDMPSRTESDPLSAGRIAMAPILERSLAR
jgi:para-nitrobenzyl esterase